jgi:hypothetical protein
VLGAGEECDTLIHSRISAVQAIHLVNHLAEDMARESIEGNHVSTTHAQQAFAGKSRRGATGHGENVLIIIIMFSTHANRSP